MYCAHVQATPRPLAQAPLSNCASCVSFRSGGLSGAQGRQSGRSGELVSRHNPRAPRLFEDRLGAGVVCETLDLGRGAISRFQRARRPCENRQLPPSFGLRTVFTI
jgi:hypothetical protein